MHNLTLVMKKCRVYTNGERLLKTTALHISKNRSSMKDKERLRNYSRSNETTDMATKYNEWPQIPVLDRGRGASKTDVNGKQQNLNMHWTLRCCYCLVAELCRHLVTPWTGSSAHRISQARILKWIVVTFSRGSSWHKDQTLVSCLAGRFFTIEPPWSIVLMLNILNLIIVLWLHKRIPLFFGEFHSRIKGTWILKITFNCYRKKCVLLCVCVCVCVCVCAWHSQEVEKKSGFEFIRFISLLA